MFNDYTLSPFRKTRTQLLSRNCKHTYANDVAANYLGAASDIGALNRRPEAHDLNIATSSLDQASDLQLIDGGFAAWRLLLGALVFEALLWGFPLSFGVFQEYYTGLPEFKDRPYISIVGTTASGVSYLGAPVILHFIRRWSKYRSQMILSGGHCAYSACWLAVLRKH